MYYIYTHLPTLNIYKYFKKIISIHASFIQQFLP